MKIVSPSVELLPQAPGLEGVYKQIELVGRTCYKSEDKITEDSAKPFVDRMIKSGHGAMLEHGTIYLGRPVFPDIGLDGEYSYETDGFYKKYIDNKFSHVEVRPFKWSGEDGCYVTTNLRVLVENNWLDDLQYICEPTEDHYLRLCMKFNTNIGVSREGNRHRTFSIAEQSTRYCNYSKAKFGEEITFVEPAWDREFLDRDTFISHLSDAESHYMALIDLGWQPQQAREVLPLCTATEVVYTAFVDDWRHFFDLRLRGTTGAPHPNMKEVAELAHKEIREKLGFDL